MSPTSRALHVVLLLAAAPLARASELCHAAELAGIVPSTAGQLVVPAFDPALGTLQSVEVEFSCAMRSLVRAENLSTLSPCTLTTSPRTTLVLQAGPSSSIQLDPATDHFDLLPPFDGAADFQGPSSTFHADVLGDARTLVTTQAADLLAFTGTGSVTLVFVTVDQSSHSGCGGLLAAFTSLLRASVRVCYRFDPAPSVFCAGDGLGAACPCANESAPGSGRGCLNSTSVGGRLAASGSASLGADTLVLSADGIPASTTAIFLQSTGAAGGGIGLAIGDGLRCVDGAIVRLAVRSTTTGAISYPLAGDPPISVAGSAPSGTTRRYQVFYRDLAPFCASDAFNWTAGLLVTWRP